MIAGFRCAVCGTTVDVATPLAWACPQASPTDPHHVLHLVDSGPLAPARQDDNPFIRYGDRLAWRAFARAQGLTDDACDALTREAAGGFRVTPFERSARLSDEIGADVWVKNETGNVGGSHKARHLASILLHLRAAETLGHLDQRPPLAIASCGNAAIAASTLAAAVDWPIQVYVPQWMDATVEKVLSDLGADIHRCERRDTDPPGDPALHRFREAVAGGAVPFSVQGPENALCLDGGRTIGWEMADQAADAGIELDTVVIQVGGGAFAGCVGASLPIPLHPIQTEGCAPLNAAWEKAQGMSDPEQHWSDLMQSWPDPHSLADGILDDETYDWLSIVDAMRRQGGQPIVAPETQVIAAHKLAHEAGYNVSPTGSAGLAGLLSARERFEGQTVAIVMSGVTR
ncbi:MAG: hypothetical protein CSA55_02960 [Ilumatobacter coccineus]|uniref:Tryptophan synthase beta chain-like PALP domain-containing protein n=1 Tax=Ilumatobacter coccineus TaxID=467094 RepID=A0A2G6KAV6_9ACTN|nr:MAG: hypothetical protein CSA55_02960 [Ilumatobacter coccineus]